MRAFSYREGNSFLHSLNPAVKLVANILLLIVVTPAFDPLTPLTFLILSLVATSWLGRIPLRDLLRGLVPFLWFAAGLVLMNALFHRQPTSSTVLWYIGPASITIEGLVVGLSIGLRVLCIISFAMMFVLTTDPRDLALSFIQQFKLNYRLGYTIMVAYRLLPLLLEELESIRAAQHVRGTPEGSPLAQVLLLRRMALPLLAGAIRRAERIAIAMDSRAFGAHPSRTYLRNLKVGLADKLFLMGTVIVSLAIAVMLWRLGVWRLPGIGPNA